MILPRFLLFACALVLKPISADVRCSAKELQSRSVHACEAIGVDFEKLTEPDVQEVIRALAMPKLEVLHLRDVKISEKQCEAIMMAVALSPAVDHVSFRENVFSLKAASALFGAVKKGNLEALDLRGTKLGDEEVSLLAEAIAGTRKLKHLDVENCGLSATGVTQIANALNSSDTSLERLFIAYNSMGDQGASALAGILKSLPFESALQEVYIQDSSIGQMGKQALREAALEGDIKIYDLRKKSHRKLWMEPGAGESRSKAKSAKTYAHPVEL